MAGRLRLVIGGDDAGPTYEGALEADLLTRPLVASVQAVGVHADGHTPNPPVAVEAAQRAADEVPGLRAVTAHDSSSAERSALSDDAQVLTTGPRVIGLGLARRLVGEWPTHRSDPSSASAEEVAEVARSEARTSA